MSEIQAKVKMLDLSISNNQVALEEIKMMYTHG